MSGSSLPALLAALILLTCVRSSCEFRFTATQSASSQKGPIAYRGVPFRKVFINPPAPMPGVDTPDTSSEARRKEELRKLPGLRASGSVRVIYVIDVSGSMKEPDKLGPVKDAVIEAISELKPTDRFCVIAFSGSTHALWDKLMPATRAYRYEARDYIDRLGFEWRSTDIGYALATAFWFKDVSHAFLLTDGIPEVGTRTVEQMRKVVREQNPRKVRVHTIGMGAGKTFLGEELLNGIAAESDGLYRYVDVSKPNPGSSP